jgi:hypothetical protein
VPGGPVAVAEGDLNNDGIPDLVTADFAKGTVTVRLGEGDGTFAAPVTYAVGKGPDAVTLADGNHDGRLDIIAANSQDGTISVLLGNGDGTFQPAITVPVGSGPDALAAGDLNGDGLNDMVVANYGSGDVSVLVNNGYGPPKPISYATGDGPCAVALADLNGDGIPDIVVTDALSQDVRVLLGVGDGTFRALDAVPLGFTPTALVTGDFNGDGHTDVVVASRGGGGAVSLLTGQNGGTVWLFAGEGDGTFASPQLVTTLTAPSALAAGDFTGDGQLDLAVADANANNITLLTSQGDGTFQVQGTFAAGTYPSGLVAADFNDDGRLDLAAVNGLGTPVTVALGFGDGTFAPPGTVFPPVQSPPIVADFNGDGIPDVVALRQDGKILFRPGLADAPGTFGSPVVVNPDPTWAARFITSGSSMGTTFLVAGSVRSGSFDLYADFGGQFQRVLEENVSGIVPSHILYGDLNGDGLDDGALYMADTGQILVFLQHPDDSFSSRDPDYVLNVGTGVSGMTLADVNGDGLPDIVLTYQDYGEIRILLNSKDTPFASQLLFRAGSGLANLVQANGVSQVQSLDQSVAVVAGLFDGGTIPDLAVLNRNDDRVDILRGDGLGGVYNPDPARSLTTGRDPVAIVTGDFNGDGIPDLAVLNGGSGDISVFLGDGHGGFTEQLSPDINGLPARLSAGESPTGLTVADLNGDGKADLLVSNGEGDVLVLLGNGDGTFRPYQRLDQHVALAVADVNHDGKPEFVLANQASDQVILSSGQSSPIWSQGRQDGVRDPNAVKLADLNGDGIPDLIVANGGGNNVLVYPGLGNGMFGPARVFFAGTDPVSVAVADLNGDGVPDLVVANKGSNDVSVLLGRGQGSTWTLTPGPRLDVGSGPVATAVADVNGDGIPDLFVANSESNNVYLLPGVGGGFFDDRHPTVFQTGQDPEQLFVGHFDSGASLGLVTVNAGSNDLTYFPGFGAGRSIATEGLTPVNAVAGDFLQNGLTDLVVLHSGDDHVTLFLAGTDGPQIAAVLSPAGLGNLSDLALGGVVDSAINIYVTVEGSNAVTGLTFVLDSSTTSSRHDEQLLQSSPPQPVTVYSTTPDQPQGAVAAVFLAFNGASPTETSTAAVEALPFETSSNVAAAASVGFATVDGSARDPSGEADEVGMEGSNVVPASLVGTPGNPPVELNVFLVGAADTLPGLFLFRGTDAEEQPLAATLPLPQPFDFSDAPALVRTLPAAPHSVPALPTTKGLSTEPACAADATPEPMHEEPVQPAACAVPAAVVDGTHGVDHGGTLASGMRWLALLFTQLLLGPQKNRKAARDKAMEMQR